MISSKLLQIQINWLCLPVTRQPQIHHHQIWRFLMNSRQKSHICEVEILGLNLQRNCVKWIFVIVEPTVRDVWSVSEVLCVNFAWCVFIDLTPLYTYTSCSHQFIFEKLSICHQQNNVLDVFFLLDNWTK